MRTNFITNRQEIENILKSCKTCYLAMSDNDVPYVIPMNFGLDGETIIMHSAQSGRMWETLKKNPKVCINWTLGGELAWQDVQVGCSYRVKSKTVLVEGVVEFVEDYNEKMKCLEKMMAHYSDLEFRFSVPSVQHVGVFRVKIDRLTAKEFGAKAPTPWKR